MLKISIFLKLTPWTPIDFIITPWNFFHFFHLTLHWNSNYSYSIPLEFSIDILNRGFGFFLERPNTISHLPLSGCTSNNTWWKCWRGICQSVSCSVSIFNTQYLIIGSKSIGKKMLVFFFFLVPFNRYVVFIVSFFISQNCVETYSLFLGSLWSCSLLLHQGTYKKDITLNFNNFFFLLFDID